MIEAAMNKYNIRGLLPFAFENCKSEFVLIICTQESR